MIVQLWSRRLEISGPIQEKLTDYIMARVEKAQARPEGLSVSYLIQEVREALRINLPTNHNDAMAVFKALGFTIGKVPNKTRPSLTRIWYVTI